MKGATWKDTAELVGIGAIVVSLIFVGMQLRQEQEIARAQALGDFVAGRIEYVIGMTAYADVLVKANSGAQLDAVEAHVLRDLVQVSEDQAFLGALRQVQLGSDLNTAELTFVSFLYRNPAARATWLHIAEDMERYVDPLRTPESLARTQVSGSSAFRSRVKAHLAKLDSLYAPTSDLCGPTPDEPSFESSLVLEGSVLIRAEREEDCGAVHALNAAAFETPAEADLVDALRVQAQPIVSLVEEHAGAVVGHIFFSPVTLSGHAGLNIMGLAPMAVAPSHQRSGIGSALVRAGLERCKALGAGAVVVLGHSSYYPRFGFVPAAHLVLAANTMCRTKPSWLSSCSPVF